MTAQDLPAWLARRLALMLALATLATIAAYIPSIRGPFLFDDLSEIVDNPAIRTLLPPWRPMFAGGELPHRPLPYLSFAVNYQVGRLASALFGTAPFDPLPFHAVNIGIHLVNGWLLYWIVGRLLAGQHTTAIGSPPPTIIAAIAATLWLVHPLQSQAVSYVYQRIELLAALAALSASAAFLQAASAVRPLPWVVLATVACGLGMACKEWAVVVPVVVLLLDRAFLAASWHDVFSRRGLWHLALFATLPILFAIVAIQRDRYPEAGFSAWQSLVYAANQPLVILWYLSRLVVPAGLSLDHGTVLRKDLLGQDLWLLGPAAGILAGAGWAVWSLPRRPAASFMILVFLLLLAPTSSILPVHDVCVEHRMYLASAIPIAAAVIACSRLGQALLPAAVVATIALATITAARNTVYRSPLIAWQDAVEKSGGSSRSLARYGTELSKRDRHEEAIAACAAAVERNPQNPVPYAALAAALLNANQPERAAAVCRAGMAAAAACEGTFRDPMRQRLSMYLGHALDRLGNPEGLGILQDLVESQPDCPGVKEYLARALLRENPRESAALWSELAEASPTDAYVVFNHGSAVARYDPRMAIPILEDAVRLDPCNADAHNNIGNAFLMIGRHTEAKAAYQRCLAIDPSHHQAGRNLAAIDNNAR